MANVPCVDSDWCSRKYDPVDQHTNSQSVRERQRNNSAVTSCYEWTQCCRTGAVQSEYCDSFCSFLPFCSCLTMYCLPCCCWCWSSCSCPSLLLMPYHVPFALLVLLLMPLLTAPALPCTVFALLLLLLLILLLHLLLLLLILTPLPPTSLLPC